METECTSRSKISLMTSCYFIGFGLGVFLFKLPDRYGRRPSLFVCMTGYLLAQFYLLFKPTLLARSIALFMYGFFHLRQSVSFVLCFETVPKQSKPTTSTAINSFDGATLIFIGTYFVFIKNWFYY